MPDKQKQKQGNKRSHNDEHVLEHLYAEIGSHNGADGKTSATARLFKRGPEQIAKKLGEEAVETLIEGMRGDRLRLVLESADLLYYLLALWEVNGVKPKAVWSELARRTGSANQKKRLGNPKVPKV